MRFGLIDPRERRIVEIHEDIDRPPFPVAPPLKWRALPPGVDVEHTVDDRDEIKPPRPQTHDSTRLLERLINLLIEKRVITAQELRDAD